MLKNSLHIYTENICHKECLFQNKKKLEKCLVFLHFYNHLLTMFAEFFYLLLHSVSWDFTHNVILKYSTHYSLKMRVKE